MIRIAVLDLAAAISSLSLCFVTLRRVCRSCAEYQDFVGVWPGRAAEAAAVLL